MNTHRIYYISDYGVVLPEKYVYSTLAEYKIKKADIPLVTLKDHHFEGWFYDEGRQLPCNINDMIVGDLPLYAKWTELRVSHITGVGERQFRFNRTFSSGLISDTVEIDNPNISETIPIDNSEGYLISDDNGHYLVTENSKLLKFVANNIIFAGQISAKDAIEDIEEQIEELRNAIDVREHGY